MTADGLDQPPTFRPIKPGDEAALDEIIRAGMQEFLGADVEPGSIHAAFADPRDRYLVVEADSAVLGGGGLKAIDANVAEVQKMYFHPALRGRGVGRRLLQRLLATARELGFTTIELETATTMQAARHLYESLGFVERPAPNVGCRERPCDRRYALRL